MKKLLFAARAILCAALLLLLVSCGCCRHTSDTLSSTRDSLRHISMRADSIGVCYFGGMSSDGKIARDTRTPKQRAALLQLVAELMAKYPGSTVHGHNEFSAKACPSFDVQTEL